MRSARAKNASIATSSDFLRKVLVFALTALWGESSGISQGLRLDFQRQRKISPQQQQWRDSSVSFFTPFLTNRMVQSSQMYHSERRLLARRTGRFPFLLLSLGMVGDEFSDVGDQSEDIHGEQLRCPKVEQCVRDLSEPLAHLPSLPHNSSSDGKVFTLSINGNGTLNDDGRKHPLDIFGDEEGFLISPVNGYSEDYCSVFDDRGCEALENIVPPCYGEDEKAFLDRLSSVDKLAKKYCIRLEAGPCKGITATGGCPLSILREVHRVREYQERFRPSDLYQRRWIQLTPNKQCLRDRSVDLENQCSQHGMHRGNAGDGFFETFTVMQFNILAEGLSSGPPERSTPFPQQPHLMQRPRRMANAPKVTLPFRLEANDGKGGNDFGGFTRVPRPDICLDFDLRRWRLLEVIMQSLPAQSKEEDCFECDCNLTSLSSLPEEVKAITNGPDILALEEVDRYHGFFRPALSSFGYRGLFVSKPSAPGIPLGWYSDGCALFWKNDDFDVLEERRGGFHAGRGQVYVIATLFHRKTGRCIVAAVTHLKARAGEENEKTRTRQAAELMDTVWEMAVRACAAENAIATEVSDSSSKARRQEIMGMVFKEEGLFSLKVNASRSCAIPVLIMGDLNTEPNQACVATLLSRKIQGRPHLQLRSAYPLEVRSLMNATAIDRTNSTYQTQPDVHAAADLMSIPYTTWKTRGEETVKHVIDYVFHNGCEEFGSDQSIDEVSEDKCVGMRCVRVLDVPDEDDVDSELLPGFRYPSDHFMIAAQFELLRRDFCAKVRSIVS